jgi:hypothetical protein
MMADDWIKTYLPESRRRLHEALLRLDRMAPKSASDPVKSALHHLSRHSARSVVRGANLDAARKMRGPKRCKIPPLQCKAHCLAEAILACEQSAPGIAANVVLNYRTAALAASTGLEKVVAKLSPATKSLVQLLGPQSRHLSSAVDSVSPEETRLLLAETLVIRTELAGATKVLRKLGDSVANVFLGDMVRVSSGKRHDKTHLDGIVRPLLGCFDDAEIAALVPDGEGGDSKDAAARMSNRRKKLVGTRKGGGFGKPGRPRHPQQ